MHVALFSAYYHPHIGGVEIVARALAEGLAQRHRVTIVTTAFGGKSGINDEKGVEVHRLPAIHAAERWSVPYPVPTGAGVRRALEALRSVDVCHAHGALYPTTLLAARTAARVGGPLILTEHVGFVEYRRQALNSLERAAWRTIGDRVVGRANRVTVVSRRVQAWLERRYPEKAVDLISNGVDLAAFRPRSPSDAAGLRERFGLPVGKTLVLFVGRAAEKKNLAAALAIPRESFTLVVCGASRELREPGVIDLGTIPHERMGDLLGGVDVMLLPSQGEGFPLAAQEALAAGLPLVLLWDDGYSGALDREVVAACTREEELTDALQRYVASPALRAEAGRRGRDWAERHWGWEAVVAAYESVYTGLARSRLPAEARR